MLKALRQLPHDETGAATTEYAIVLGLIVVAVIAIVAQVGPRVLAAWAKVEHKLDGEDATTLIIPPAAHDH
jgi:Flp pilus assembly pilin Flp